MLLTITTQYQPATDLGYLLHKHPDRFQSTDLTIGKAHVFYPTASAETATVALLLDIDPIEMVRGGKNFSGKGFSLGQYVNDRPYVASSFMSVAMSKVFGTAMNGTCKDRPELVEVPLLLNAKISVLSARRGGEQLLRRLFEPLGYEMEIERHPLDTKFEEWGESRYYSVSLNGTLPLQDLLTHLYILIPVLDNDKHYFVGEHEIEKLLDKGKRWLPNHPEKRLITSRYLNHLKSYANKALASMEEEHLDESLQEEKVKKETLHQQRLSLVFEKMKASGAKKVLDLGCGEGKLLRLLMKDSQFEKIAGMDVVFSSLKKAKERLRLDRLPMSQSERIDLFQGSLTYKDSRLEGFDAAALVEVIEHLDEDRLRSLERVVFEFSKPKKVFLTTPNSEYNVLYEKMTPGSMRHSDHRFEWTRSEFQTWADRVANEFNYKVEFLPIGEEDEKVGAPSQMAIFSYEN